MKKEFIPYKQALELKELGFDEPCFKKYIAGCLWSSPTTPEIYENVYSNSSDCLAPLYQQAFRWFREKYNYYISVFRTHDGNWGVDLWLLGVHKPKATIFSETYEEAELACLNKLIELTYKPK